MQQVAPKSASWLHAEAILVFIEDLRSLQDVT